MEREKIARALTETETEKKSEGIMSIRDRKLKINE